MNKLRLEDQPDDYASVIRDLIVRAGVDGGVMITQGDHSIGMLFRLPPPRPE